MHHERTSPAPVVAGVIGACAKGQGGQSKAVVPNLRSPSRR